MLRVGRFEVLITLQVVRQEADAQLQGDDPGAPGQHADLRLGHAGAGAHIALGVGAVETQVDADLAQIRLVLSGGGSAEADGIAVVIQAQAGHNGVQIQDAQGLAGVAVEQDVVELGVVVGDAQGQLAGFAHALQEPRLALAGHDEADLLLHGFGAVAHILLQGVLKQDIAVDGVVELGDGLMELLRREVPQHLLEMTEGDGALIEVLGGLRRFQAEAAHEFIHPPVFAAGILVIELAAVGGDEVQGAAGIANALAQKFRHRADVLHQRLGILEHILVDAL